IARLAVIGKTDGRDKPIVRRGSLTCQIRKSTETYALARVAGAGPAAHALLRRASGPPLPQHLVAVLLVPDEIGALYVQSEQVELPLGAPVDRLLKPPAVPLPNHRVLNVDGAAAELQFAGPVLPVADGGLHEATAVAQQVQRLPRPPHHAEVELPVHDQRLHGADSREAVPADGADEGEAGRFHPLLTEAGQLRRCCGELSPVHGMTSLPSR